MTVKAKTTLSYSLITIGVLIIVVFLVYTIAMMSSIKGEKLKEFVVSKTDKKGWIEVRFNGEVTRELMESNGEIISKLSDSVDLNGLIEKDKKSWLDWCIDAGNKSLGGLYSIAAIAAIIWGIKKWYKERLGFPRGKTIVNVMDLKISDDHRLIHAAMVVENIGNVPIEIKSFFFRFQLISPIDYQHVELLGKLKKAYFGGDSKDDDIYEEGDIIIPWSTIKKQVREIKEGDYIKVEPGETQTLGADILVPLDFEVIRVYGHVRNYAERIKDFGWGCEKIHIIRSNKPNGREREG